MNKLPYYLSMFVILIMLGLTLVNMYWTFYPYNVEKVYDQQAMPILNSGHTLKGGDTIRWRAHYEMYLDKVPVDFTFYLEPTPGQTACDFRILLQGSSVTTKGEVDHTNASVIVPEGFKPCTYHVKIVSLFHPNPSRTISIVVFTEPFNVK